jgi:predicted ATP-dependent serine protease
MSNYKNRRKRGQCASCTNQALQNAVRCQSCKEKHINKQRINSEATNASRRERAFYASLERERRLEEIELRLQQEIAELERAVPR